MTKINMKKALQQDACSIYLMVEVYRGMMMAMTLAFCVLTRARKLLKQQSHHVK